MADPEKSHSELVLSQEDETQILESGTCLQGRQQCGTLQKCYGSVANFPGLTRRLLVSVFNLRAPGVALQSPGYGVSCICMKKPLPDRSDVISEVPK